MTVRNVRELARRNARADVKRSLGDGSATSHPVYKAAYAAAFLEGLTTAAVQHGRQAGWESAWEAKAAADEAQRERERERERLEAERAIGRGDPEAIRNARMMRYCGPRGRQLAELADRIMGGARC